MLWCLIPIIASLVCALIFEYRYESFCNREIRRKEKEKHIAAYNKYIESIKKALEKTGIDNKEKRECLKQECYSALKKHDNKFSIVNSKIFEILIGAPIGTLIAFLIHKDNSVLTNEIIFIILVGISLICDVKLAKTISFYSEGYLKDRHMLDALEEVEYSF